MLLLTQRTVDLSAALTGPIFAIAFLDEKSLQKQIENTMASIPTNLSASTFRGRPNIVAWVNEALRAAQAEAAAPSPPNVGSGAPSPAALDAALSTLLLRLHLLSEECGDVCDAAMTRITDALPRARRDVKTLAADAAATSAALASVAGGGASSTPEPFILSLGALDAVKTRLESVRAALARASTWDRLVREAAVAAEDDKEGGLRGDAPELDAMGAAAAAATYVLRLCAVANDLSALPGSERRAETLASALISFEKVAGPLVAAALAGAGAGGAAPTAPSASLAPLLSAFESVHAPRTLLGVGALYAFGPIVSALGGGAAPLPSDDAPPAPAALLGSQLLPCPASTVAGGQIRSALRAGGGAALVAAYVGVLDVLGSAGPIVIHVVGRERGAQALIRGLGLCLGSGSVRLESAVASLLSEVSAVDAEAVRGVTPPVEAGDGALLASLGTGGEAAFLTSLLTGWLKGGASPSPSALLGLSSGAVTAASLARVATTYAAAIEFCDRLPGVVTPLISGDPLLQAWLHCAADIVASPFRSAVESAPGATALPHVMRTATATAFRTLLFPEGAPPPWPSCGYDALSAFSNAAGSVLASADALTLLADAPLLCFALDDSAEEFIASLQGQCATHAAHAGRSLDVGAAHTSRRSAVAGLQELTVLAAAVTSALSGLATQVGAAVHARSRLLTLWAEYDATSSAAPRRSFSHTDDGVAIDLRLRGATAHATTCTPRTGLRRAAASTLLSEIDRLAGQPTGDWLSIVLPKTAAALAGWASSLHVVVFEALCKPLGDALSGARHSGVWAGGAASDFEFSVAPSPHAASLCEVLLGLAQSLAPRAHPLVAAAGGGKHSATLPVLSLVPRPADELPATQWLPLPHSPPSAHSGAATVPLPPSALVGAWASSTASHVGALGNLRSAYVACGVPTDASFSPFTEDDDEGIVDGDDAAQVAANTTALTNIANSLAPSSATPPSWVCAHALRMGGELTPPPASAPLSSTAESAATAEASLWLHALGVGAVNLLLTEWFAAPPTPPGMGGKGASRQVRADVTHLSTVLRSLGVTPPPLLRAVGRAAGGGGGAAAGDAALAKTVARLRGV